MRIAPEVVRVHRERVNRARGFTLIELLLIIAIIAVLALVAAPWFSRISQRGQLRSAARELQSTLLGARMTAVRNGIPVSVRITPAAAGSDHHSIETWLEATPARRLGEVRLRTNVRFVPPLPPGNDVVFTADGRRVPPATAHEDIVIEGVVGSSLLNQITIETWENGRVAFVTPVTWK